MTDDLGLKLFAAWCGTTPEHAATRDAWTKTQHSEKTRKGWERVAETARQECARSHSAFQRQLSEAFNSGDGSYKP